MFEPTQPDSDTCDPGEMGLREELALVLIWSAADPGRVGEVAFLRGSTWCHIGRGDKDEAEFANFGPQCPGVTVDDARPTPRLRGSTMSGRQVSVRVQGQFIEMKFVKGCLTLVNGVPRKSALLGVGHVLLFRGVAAFVCVRRPRTLPSIAEFPALAHPFGERDAFGIVGESAQTWAMRIALAKAAKSKFHALLLGASGAGKELAAGAFHKLTGRRGHLVGTSAALSTGSLLESRLVGSAKNYPNMGQPAVQGLFMAADGSTLFFDEIGDCPESYQAALLRTLDKGEVMVQGESVARYVDIRVVAATNREITRIRPELVARFIKHVHVPALCDRREDIPLLVRYLLLTRAAAEPELLAPFLYTGETGRTEVRISGRVIDYLVRHPLSTNVRELESLLDGLVSTSTGSEIRLPATAEDADEEAAPGDEPASGDAASEKVSEEQVRAALKAAGGNVAVAAKALGVPRPTLYRWIKEYGIERGKV